MKIKMFIALFSILIISGCVPSLHQLWTDKTLVYDEAFVGKFQHDKEVWEFTGDPDNKSYKLVITKGKDEESKLSAHLVNVDGQLFFDFYPDGDIEAGDYTKMHLIGVHLFWKAEKTENGFVLAAMDPEEVGKLLKEKPELIKHERIEDDRVVLTDTPENLQKFLIVAPKLNKKVFGEPEAFVRITD